MISFNKACSLAKDYYANNLNVSKLLEARENESVYIFSAGEQSKLCAGGCTIAIEKETGCISVLQFPSKESSALFRSAVVIDLPSDIKD